MAAGSTSELSWTALVGDEPRVPCDTFLDALSSRTAPPLTAAERRTLAATLDVDRRGSVGRAAWQRLAPLWAPVREALDAVWFHGALRGSDAPALLGKQRVGAFLIALPAEAHRTAALQLLHVVASGARRVVNVVRITLRDDGTLELAGQTAHYASLRALVAANSALLQHPYTARFHTADWWIGNVRSRYAERLLRGEDEGRFLVRGGDCAGDFVLHWVFNGRCSAGAIAGCMDSTAVTLAGRNYDSLEAVVQECQQAGILTSPLAPQVAQMRLAREHRDAVMREWLMTQRRMVEVFRTFAVDVFRAFQENSAIDHETIVRIFGNSSQVCNVHSEFLERLETLFVSDDDGNATAVDDISALVGHIEWFAVRALQVHVDYIRHVEQHMRPASDALALSRHAQWLTETLARFGQTSIMSFGVMPVSRIPRFQLFASDIQRSGLWHESEVETFDKVVDILRTLSDDINSRVRRN